MANPIKPTIKKRGRGQRPTARQAAAIKKKVLGDLANGSTASGAAISAGIDITTLHQWRKKSEEFAEAWDNAIESGTDTIEDEARRRAVDGVEEPVFYKGEKIALVTKYSDTLLMFLLNGRRPEKFKRQQRMTMLGDKENDIEVTIRIGDAKPSSGE